jgi:NAD(P)-dependent dehydrogenase (short-subunit alcohol dehydrogenase family)
MELDIRDRAIVVRHRSRSGTRPHHRDRLAHEGARVGVLTRDRARSQAVADEIAAIDSAPPALALQADVTDEDAVAAAAREISESWGRLDALINDAGWTPGRHPVLEMDRAVLDRAIGSNLIGGFVTTRHLAPLMIAGGGGRIVYVTSIAGTQSGPGGSAYAAAKAGLNILTNIVHQELADDGIRTVAIAPGLTVTPGMEAIITPEHVDRVAAAYPGRRIGQPQDIVGLTVFLCSDASEHLSGTVITVRPPVRA